MNCPRCGGAATPRPHDSAYCGRCFLTFRPSAPELAPGASRPQLDIFGGEQQLAPEPPAPCTSTHEQPRLFEPQYEGQLALAGGDNPEERLADG